MRTSPWVPLAAILFVACTNSPGTTEPQGSGGNNSGGSNSTGGSVTGGTTSSGGSVGTGGSQGSGGSTATSSGGSNSGGSTNPGMGGAGSGGRTGTSAGGANAGGSTTTSAGGANAGGSTTTSAGGANAGGSTGTGAGGARMDGGVGGARMDGSVGTGAGGAGAGGAATGGTTTSAGGSTGTTASTTENSGASCNATSAPLLSSQLKKLPDPFAMHSGTRIAAKADWECRRNEMLEDIYKYEIGPKPDPSETTTKATLSGTSLSIAVTSSSGSLTIKTNVGGSGSCVVIATDMALNLISGCTNVTFSTNDVIPYNGGSGSQRQSDPFYKVFPSLWGKIGNYTAWSWGVSRLIDGLDQVKDQLKIDMTKIATHGCSYAGKMALFAGALDERVALTVAEESGGGGICAWRASQDFTTRTGTNVEKIDNTNYAWFMSSMKSLDPYKLPHDHHELIAAVAPRAIIILGNPEYEWLGDESGYKSTIAASEVFKALGVADHIGWDFTGNHAHCSAPQSQKDSINAFANKFLKGQTSANTNIAIKPVSSKFDLSADYDWTAPTLQ